MNKINFSSSKAALYVSAVLLFGGLADASEFPQATAAAELSLAHGFTQSSLPLLHRETGGNSAKAIALLLQNLCQAPCSGVTTASISDKVNVASDHWSLEVAGNGTTARFQDNQAAARAHSLARDVSQKTAASDLESAGRAFIASKLKSVIVLGAGEALVPLRADYRIEGGQDTATGATTNSVVANRIVFGRTIHGVPVVGGGSTVVLTFLNDGSLESFRYDWPNYQAGSSQVVVEETELLNRVQKAVAARSDVQAGAFSATLPKSKGAPVALAKDTVLQKLVCGYYDPGSAARDANAPVQPGCAYHAVSETAGGIRRGFAGAIPAGAQIQPDAAWTEVHILGNLGVPEEKPIEPSDARQ